ncbi:hypothetical protein ACINWC743_1578 [Acinetobacter sp. WC-743]|nr:hypothetical protein ACINWC743_1578 [Acinetobacter sp. WC-743]
MLMHKKPQLLGMSIMDTPLSAVYALGIHWRPIQTLDFASAELA